MVQQGEDGLLSKWRWEELDGHMQENETGPARYIRHKN